MLNQVGEKKISWRNSTLRATLIRCRQTIADRSIQNIIGDGPSGVIGQSLPRAQPDVRIRRGQPSELGGFWGRPLFRKDAVSKPHLRHEEIRVSSHRSPITASSDRNGGCLDLTPGLFGASSAVRMQHASQAHPVIEPKPSPMKTKILWDVNISGGIQPPALSDDIRETLEHIATVEEIETASETEVGDTCPN